MAGRVIHLQQRSFAPTILVMAARLDSATLTLVIVLVTVRTLITPNVEILEPLIVRENGPTGVLVQLRVRRNGITALFLYHPVVVRLAPKRLVKQR